MRFIVQHIFLLLIFLCSLDGSFSFSWNDCDCNCICDEIQCEDTKAEFQAEFPIGSNSAERCCEESTPINSQRNTRQTTSNSNSKVGLVLQNIKHHSLQYLLSTKIEKDFKVNFLHNKYTNWQSWLCVYLH